jgi:hypothetical protein|tara:strand:+ start:4105 stop:4458 length:354 start_codon:yes stop_codon:yes gene_type:complete
MVKKKFTVKERFRQDEIDSEGFPHDRYIGDYVIISTLNGNSEVGKLIGFIDGYALLSPFLGPEHTPKGLVKRFFEDTLIANMHPSFSVVPTTRENMDRYCEFQNREYQEGRKKKKRK